jgi:hypothetical protein
MVVVGTDARARGKESPLLVNGAFIGGRIGYVKVRYRGLRKNLAKFEILFALANLVLAKRELLAEARA